MSAVGKKLAIGLIVLLAIGVLLGLAIQNRHQLMFAAVSTGAPPPLLEKNPAIAQQYWRGDYYTVVMLDARTFAIGEPRIPGKNFNYLIVGTERALLFDAGAGHYDILPIARQITDLPITFVPSHLHFDHVGDMAKFDHIAIVDLPHLRDQAAESENGNRITLTWEQHLGTSEGIPAPTFEVGEWIAPDSMIDLGGRSLQLLHTPGHTTDSVSLYDEKAGQFFSGDFIYPAAVFAFMPNSNLGDMLKSASDVLARLPTETKIYGAHGPQNDALPLASMADLADLKEALEMIREGELEGEGTPFISYPVNERMLLMAEAGWLQNWTPTYADR